MSFSERHDDASMVPKIWRLARRRHHRDGGEDNSPLQPQRVASRGLRRFICREVLAICQRLTMASLENNSSRRKKSISVLAAATRAREDIMLNHARERTRKLSARTSTRNQATTRRWPRPFNESGPTWFDGGSEGVRLPDPLKAKITKQVMLPTIQPPS